VYGLVFNLPNDSRNNSSIYNHVHDTSSLPPQWTQCIEKLTNWFKHDDFYGLALKTKFIRRNPRKISPLLFLQSAILLVSQSSVSLSKWAMMLGILGHGSLAKQSLWQRINQGAVDFIQHVLAMVLNKKSLENFPHTPGVLNNFKRVLVQDSTTIKLNEKLAAVFPGSKNIHGFKNGLLKIQATHDLLEQRFIYFGLSGFNRNDQTAAQDIFKILRRGDLVLRDLGYHVIKTFERIAEAGGFFLSRMRLDTTLSDPSTAMKLDLLKELQRHGNLDRQVLLAKSKLPVRLVAIKLPEAVAAERRRKAKCNRDKRCKPNPTRLKLLGWALYVTNVSKDTCTPCQVAEIYGLRWRIESIFKVWKSHFQMTDVPKGSAEQLRIVVCARLIFITLLAELGRQGWLNSYNENKSNHCSIFKVASLLRDYFLALCIDAWNINVSKALLIQLHYHCRYEKRSRQNYVQKLLSLS
jgi:hypothetical protein